MDEKLLVSLNESGAHLRAANHFRKAETVFRIAIELFPRVPELHKNLGDVLLHLGLVDQAISSFETATKLNPNYARAYSRLGECLASKGDFVAVNTMLVKAIGIERGSDNPAIKASDLLVKVAQNCMVIGSFNEAKGYQKTR